MWKIMSDATHKFLYSTLNITSQGKNWHNHLLHGSAKQSGKGVLVLDRKMKSFPLPTPKPLHESLQIFNSLIT